MMFNETISNRRTDLKPHFEAHKKYISFIENRTSCIVTKTNNNPCEFVRHTTTCHELENLIGYSDLIYCQLSNDRSSSILGIMLIIALTVVYATILALLGFNKFGPNILTVVKTLKLTQNGAAILVVTLLNSIPALTHLCVSYAKHSDFEMFMSEIMAADMFTKSFEAGILLIYFPLKVFPRYFFRDNFFFLTGFLIIIEICWSGQGSFFKAFLLIVIWIIFIAVILIEEFYHLPRNQENLHVMQQPILPAPKRKFRKYQRRNSRLFQQFLRDLNPSKIKKNDIPQDWPYNMLFLALPIKLILNILIPVVDENLPRNGWSKLLNCVNLVATPLLFLVIWRNVIFQAGAIITSLVLAFFVFCNSRTDEPPKYHLFFAFYGNFGCLLMTYIVIGELVAILHLYGALLALDRATIGIIFLGPGIAITGGFLCLSLACDGYPLMAYSSLRSDCVFRQIFGLGMVLIIKSLVDEKTTFSVRSGSFGENSIVFILLELCFSFLSALITNFNLIRSIGYFMISIYLLYFLYIMLSEFEFMHQYGCAHSDEIESKVKWA